MFPQLQTKRLLLDRFRPEDQNFVFSALSHPDVIRHYGVEYHSLEATKEQMDYFENLYLQKMGIWWKIADKENGTPLGGIGMNNYQMVYNRAEIGYWLLPHYWGRGIISEAMKVMTDYLFREWGLHRLEGVVEEGNSNSSRVLERAGFVYEGTLRDCELKKGKYISLMMFSLLATDKR
jgi:[ribosomal protein S5]-alanine N-acetyltransferase